LEAAASCFYRDDLMPIKLQEGLTGVPFDTHTLIFDENTLEYELTESGLFVLKWKQQEYVEPRESPLGTPGLIVDLDPNAMKSYLAEGDMTQFCPDVSGQRNHAVQANPGLAVTFRNSAFNGYAGLEGINSSTFLRTPSLPRMGLGCTYIYVGERTGAHIEHNHFVSMNDTDAQFKETHGGDGSTDRVKWEAAGGFDTGWLSTVPFAVAVRVRPSGATPLDVFYNGVALSTNPRPIASSPRDNPITLTIGHGTVTTGRVMGFNRDLEDDELDLELHGMSVRFALGF
jgi:hypothetical protein